MEDKREQQRQSTLWELGRRRKLWLRLLAASKLRASTGARPLGFDSLLHLAVRLWFNS